MSAALVPNLHAAWIGMLCGAAFGAVLGLFFHGEEWLGGYASWPRRMLRLGHIALFGIALINLSFALTAGALRLEGGLAWPSGLLIVGAVTMPLVCFLSAWRKPFRHLFFVPAASVIVALALFVWRLLSP
jgi:hypothetical protein